MCSQAAGAWKLSKIMPRGGRFSPNSCGAAPISLWELGEDRNPKGVARRLQILRAPCLTDYLLSGGTLVPAILTCDTDSDLKRRILNFLDQRHVPSLRSIHVDVEQGVVTMRGRVDSFYHKQLCLNCCQRVAGVVQVNDEIRVA
jgi:hypothetical protein